MTKPHVRARRALVGLGLSMLVALDLAAPSAAAQADGVSVAVVAVGKDSPSEGQAVVVGRIAKQGFERNPKYALLDTWRVLENGQTPAAAERRQRADAALARGRAALDALELSPALESLAEAVVGYEQALAAMSDIDALVSALALQGAAYALSGDTKNARRAFERVFVVDPGATLPSTGLPEEVTSLFEETRLRVGKAPTGTLTIYAAPPAAEVWIDGRFRGSAPLSVDNLPAGRHYVRVARDGYAAFGQPVEVKRRAEETVQATLRPTARFAEYDDLALRLRGGSPQAAAELAAMLKVDQLLSLVTEVMGDDVTVTATLTDGVGGGTLAQGTKTFVTTSPRYRSDLELWLAQTFRRQQGADAQVGGPTPGAPTDPSRGFVPEAPKEAPTSGMTILGWVLTGGAILPLGVGVGFGVASLVPWDAYKNGGELFDQPALKSQLDPALPDVQRSFFLTSLIADVGYVVAATMAAVGVTLLVLGANQEQQIEDVLARAPAPALPAPLVIAEADDDPRP